MLTEGKLIECSPKQIITKKESADPKKGTSALGIIYGLSPGYWHGCQVSAFSRIGTTMSYKVGMGTRTVSGAGFRPHVP